MFGKAFVFSVFLFLILAVYASASLVEEVNVGYQYDWYASQSYKTEDLRFAFNFKEITAGNFYRDLSSGEFSGMTDFESRLISGSKTAGDFLSGLKKARDEMSVEQKLLLLQRLGDYLDANYNSALSSNNQHIKISDDQMFSGLQHYFLTRGTTLGGICGNIHTFLVKAAESLGMEAWLQSGLTRQNNGHIFAGLIIEQDGQKQIAFLDYKNVILTGTNRYDEALGVMERYFGQIGLFNSFIGTKDKALFPVDSLASKKLKSAVGYYPAEKVLSDHLGIGGIAVPRRVLSLKTGNETTELSYESEYLGIAFIDFQDSGNPYNSLDSFQAVRGYFRFAGQNVEVKVGNTVVSADVKDLGKGIVEQNFIVPLINFNYADNYRLARRLSLNFGAGFETGVRSPDFYFGEAATGVRLVYLFDKSSIFIEGIQSIRSQFSDFQDQESAVKLMSRQLKIGGSLKIGRGMIYLESGLAKTDVSVKDSVSLNFVSGRIKTGISYEKENSDFQRFVSDKELVSGEVGYRLGASEKPFGEIGIYGSKTIEQYSDSPKRPTYETGVLMKLFF
ncbi:MAG: hypothetical protein HYW34_04010 [Candidatus Brennerbacteria bacterium]|nr:hypothetical protein [Candidatus Brennerbacteria bacterium]